MGTCRPHGTWEYEREMWVPEGHADSIGTLQGHGTLTAFLSPAQPLSPFPQAEPEEHPPQPPLQPLPQPPLPGPVTEGDYGEGFEPPDYDDCE